MPDDNNGDAVRRSGRWMMLLAWVAVLGLLMLIFNDRLTARFNPNRSPDARVADDGVQEVVLVRNVRGHYVTSGGVNGVDVTFLLDTGATDVAVPEKLASRLGLKRGVGGVSQTANGPVAVWQTRLDEVRLGGIRLHDVRASIVPSLDGDGPVLLGMSFLKRVDFEQRDGLLILRLG